MAEESNIKPPKIPGKLSHAQGDVRGLKERGLKTGAGDVKGLHQRGLGPARKKKASSGGKANIVQDDAGVGLREGVASKVERVNWYAPHRGQFECHRGVGLHVWVAAGKVMWTQGLSDATKSDPVEIPTTKVEISGGATIWLELELTIAQHSTSSGTHSSAGGNAKLVMYKVTACVFTGYTTSPDATGGDAEEIWSGSLTHYVRVADVTPAGGHVATTTQYLQGTVWISDHVDGYLILTG